MRGCRAATGGRRGGVRLLEFPGVAVKERTVTAPGECGHRSKGKVENLRGGVSARMELGIGLQVDEWTEKGRKPMEMYEGAGRGDQICKVISGRQSKHREGSVGSVAVRFHWPARQGVIAVTPNDIRRRNFACCPPWTPSTPPRHLATWTRLTREIRSFREKVLHSHLRRHFPIYLPLISGHSPFSGHPSRSIAASAGFSSPASLPPRLSCLAPLSLPLHHCSPLLPTAHHHTSPPSCAPQLFPHLLQSAAFPPLLPALLLAMAFISATPVLASTVRFSRAACAVRPGK